MRRLQLAPTSDRTLSCRTGIYLQLVKQADGIQGMELNLWQIFQQVSGAVPGEDAIVTHDRRISYAELADRSARLASVLAANGLGCQTPRGELPNWQVGQSRVALVMHNGHEYAECLLGSFAAR